VYEPGPGAQLHDLNPSLGHPTGLFWTESIPTSAISVQPAHGTAIMQVEDANVFDHGDFVHAILGGPPDLIPATTSFRVEWLGGGEEFVVNRADDGHSGVFVLGSARMSWTASAGDYDFVSDPIETSSSSFAVVGVEQNGIFRPPISNRGHA